jgi:hypothetical protein
MDTAWNRALNDTLMFLFTFNSLQQLQVQLNIFKKLNFAPIERKYFSITKRALMFILGIMWNTPIPSQN